MRDFKSLVHHPVSDQLVNILCERTQNNNTLFFRVMVAHYWSLVASMLRVSVVTQDRGEIPVNFYGLNLGTSGSGKGYSTNILEKEVLAPFRKRFTEEAFQARAAINLNKLASQRAARHGTDPADELKKLESEFAACGPLLFSFDSGTPAAVKQMRHKLLLADAGSMNLQIDEIGSNLISNVDMLNTFLELYDVGAIKQKLVKNTLENTRNEEIVGLTPTNLLMFGTPSKLLNGGKVEEELYSFLETGYARRCFFGYSKATDKMTDLTAAEIFDMLTNPSSEQFLTDLADKLELLADAMNMNRKIVVPRDVSILLIEYKMNCEARAMELAEHEEMKKAEFSHRYFKVLKLAGAYAFIDDAPEVTEDHIYYAIKLAEDSGDAFHQILTRERNHVKLAKYIASCKRDVTQADLVEDLPFYKGTIANKAEMMALAISWGYQNNYIIKTSYMDSIQFFRGESLEVTNTEALTLSWSDRLTEGYTFDRAPWSQLHELVMLPDKHWVNHALRDGYRDEEHVIPGFDMIVIDVDEGTSIATAMALLKDYKYLMYTTKRHTEENNRFRIIFPINYRLKLDGKEYREFMTNIFEWLPFTSDETTGQRARKWMTNPGDYHYNDGEIFDALPFIPKTAKNEERKKLLSSQTEMDSLERWVINNTGDGNRNNMLLRYAMVMVDAGADYEGVTSRVSAMNSKLVDKLEEVELHTTIYKSVARALEHRNA